MKHFNRLVVIAFIVALACSCTESKLKQLAQDFTTAVAKNDTAAIVALYPDAKMADKLVEGLPTDKITIVEKADTFVVNFDADHSLSVVQTNDGDFRIVNSHGIFSFPAERMDLALKTGWVKKGMSDLQIAEQFTDTTFINYLSKKYIAQFKSKLTIGKSVDGVGQQDIASMSANYIVNVVNKTNQEIKGTDYKVWVGDEAYNGGRDWEFSSSPGKDVKPGEKQRIVIKYPIAGGEGPNVLIRFTIPDEELFAKYFTPKGDEYEQYMRSPVSKKNK